MPRAPRLLLALALAAAPAAAQAPPFSTELTVGFGYASNATDRPLVVLDGVESAGYDYSADGSVQEVGVAATRWLAPVSDDGKTPLALLPYAARASSVTAAFSLSGTRRDSLGRFTGQASRLEVSFAGDGSVRDAALGAEWFLGRSVALRGGLAYSADRETAASTSIESPSGRAEVSTTATRGTLASGALGVAVRLGDHEVSLSGRYGASERTRDDASALTGAGTPFLATLETDGTVREAALAVRLLLLGRRLAVDASGTFSSESSSSDLSTVPSSPWAKGSATGREGALAATWYATRELGLSLGFAYATRDAESGAPGRERPSSAETRRSLRAGARWHASPRAAVFLSGDLVGSATVSPPDASTFQRFETSAWRAVLGAALRL